MSGAERGLGAGDVGEPVLEWLRGSGDTETMGASTRGGHGAGDAGAPATVCAGGGVAAARADGAGAHGHTGADTVVTGGAQVGGQC